MLQNALLRRSERDPSLHNGGGASSTQSPPVPPQPGSGGGFGSEHMTTGMAPTGLAVDTGLDRVVNEINPALFSGANETRFFADVFDPSLGSWLTDSFMNTQASAEALQGTSLGDLQDFSLLRSGGGPHDVPHPGAAQEINPNFQFGFFPSVNSNTPSNNNTNQANLKPNRYSISVPASVVDET